MELGKKMNLIARVKEPRVEPEIKILEKNGKHNFGTGDTRENEDEECMMMLVVWPPDVLSTWETQLAEHTVAGTLKMYVHYGPRLTNDAEVLKDHDAVLISCLIVYTEQRIDDSPLMSSNWRRIILDDAHAHGIKNHKSSTTGAIYSLKARRRWVITGTPEEGGTSALFSLITFLQFQPFSTELYWQKLVSRYSVRRTKDKKMRSRHANSVDTCFVELFC